MNSSYFNDFVMKWCHIINEGGMTPYMKEPSKVQKMKPHKWKTKKVDKKKKCYRQLLSHIREWFLIIGACELHCGVDMYLNTVINHSRVRDRLQRFV